MADRSSDLEVYLHPLVIINISDHWTRFKMRDGAQLLQKKSGTSTSSSSSSSSNNKTQPTDMRVIGALMGTQEGRIVKIHTSFELVYDIVDGTVVIDNNYLKTKMEQYAAVFKKYEILGWYSTGDKIKANDYATHKQIMEFNENPLYLTCGTTFGPQIKELPVDVFESVINISPSGEVQVSFRSVNYKIETEESERISVDHVAHIQDSGAKVTSSLVAHLGGLYNAVKMLNVRLREINSFLEATAKNEIPPDHETLRQIGSLCNRLPTVDSQKFSIDFQNELNESLLIAYMSTMTKGTNQMNEVIDKFNTAYDRARRRAFG